MSAPIRFLAFNYEYPPIGGGGGVLSEHVLEHFVEQGHSATLITSGFKGLPERETRAGVDIHRLPVWFRLKKNTASIVSMLSYYPQAVAAATQLSKSQHFDAVLTFFAIPTGPAGDRVARKLNLPNALFLLGGDVYDPSKRLSPHKTPLLNQTVAGVIRRADYVSAGSQDTRASALNYYGVNRDIEVVPLSIEPFAVPTTTKADLGVSEDTVLIVTVGRLVKRKNNEALLTAIQSLSASGRKQRIKLCVIGSGPEQEALQSKIDMQGIGDRVTLLGNVTDDVKAQYLAAADVYASTSIHEGFGLVFLEAMHAGLPVVCFDNGGQADFIHNDKNGYIVTLNDQKTFESALGRLIDNAGTREAMAAFNREDVKQYYVANACRRYLQSISKLVTRV